MPRKLVVVVWAITSSIGIDGKTYVVKMHSDPYSNEKVPDSVETCDGITRAVLAVGCSGSKPLYECQP